MTTTLLAILSQFAFGSTVTELDFNGWNPNVLSTDGGVQLFPNAATGLDVTVSSFGEFDAPAQYIATQDGGVDAVKTSHAPNDDSNCHGYVFAFSQPTDLVIYTESLDAEEEYKISSEGSTLSYTNESGASPIVTSESSSSIRLDGVAYGRDALVGSSDGSTFIESPDSGPFSVRLCYCADASANTKHNLFRIFSASPAVTTQSVVQLPEPNPAALLGIGGMLVLLSSRRRRR